MEERLAKNKIQRLYADMDDMDYQNENSKGFAQVVKVKVLTCYKKLLI